MMVHETAVMWAVAMGLPWADQMVYYLAMKMAAMMASLKVAVSGFRKVARKATRSVDL
jgi:hypothetical protein